MPNHLNLQLEQPNIKNVENSSPKMPLRLMDGLERDSTPEIQNTIDNLNNTNITTYNRDEQIINEISNSNIENSFSIRKKLALLGIIFPFELKITRHKLSQFQGQEFKKSFLSREYDRKFDFQKTIGPTRHKVHINSNHYGLLSFKNQILYNKKNSIFIATLRYFNINDNLHLIHKVNYSVETFDKNVSSIKNEKFSRQPYSGKFQQHT